MQDFLDEIVDDVAVVSGGARDEAGDVVASLDRQSRQLESGDPAFGAPLQRVLTTALYERFASRGEADFADRVLSAMRFGFGGHEERKG